MIFLLFYKFYKHQSVWLAQFISIPILIGEMIISERPFLAGELPLVCWIPIVVNSKPVQSAFSEKHRRINNLKPSAPRFFGCLNSPRIFLRLGSVAPRSPGEMVRATCRSMRDGSEGWVPWSDGMGPCSWNRHHQMAVILGMNSWFLQLDHENWWKL
jgi:hypothetical protein